MNSMSRIAQVLVVLVVIISLVGCGTPVPPTTPTLPPPPTVAPTVEPTSTPKVEEPSKPRIVTVAMNYEIRNIDPAFATYDDLTQGPMDNFYDSLIVLRGNPPEAHPQLAERWEHSDDLMEWTFYLDKRAKFHDGTPVTAEAVKYSWDRMLDLKAGMTFLWQGLAEKESLTVMDNHTIKFSLKEPNLPFLLTLKFFKVLNPQLVRANKLDGEFGDEGDYGQAWLVENVAGSGPYTTGTWEAGRQYDFQAVQEYWAGWPQENYPDLIVHRVTRELRSRMLAVQTGEADFTLISDAMPPEREELSQHQDLVVAETPSYLHWMLMLNNQEGPTTDPNVRKAIAHAFDYEGFLPAVAGLFLVESPLPKGSTYFESQDMPDFNLEKAREYLAKSAYPDGGFTLDVIHSGTFELALQAVLILNERMKQLNIELNLMPKTWSEMTAACGSLDTAPDIWVGGVASWVPDPDMYLKMTFHSRNWGQWSACHYYKNERVDSLIDAGAREADPKKRAEVYAEIQELILEDQPVVWMAQSSRPSVYNKTRLQNMDEALGPATPAEPIWLMVSVNQ